MVRKANGMEPFLQFIRSFEKYRPGDEDWTLILIFKGFEGATECQPYLDAAQDLKAGRFDVSDEGYDISAYLKAVEHFHFETVLLFNSFSEILAPHWLDFYRERFQPGVGMIGATASFESTSSAYLRIAKDEKNPILKSLRYLKTLYLVCLFPLFPNVHLRTNAIMVRTSDFLREKRAIRTKMQALRFESGRRSLSRRLMKRGQKVFLLTKRGELLEAGKWPAARVFRSGDQNDLLIGDNQTRAYAAASAEGRKELQISAWGRVLETQNP